jgi:hypothetical protein
LPEVSDQFIAHRRPELHEAWGSSKGMEARVEFEQAMKISGTFCEGFNGNAARYASPTVSRFNIATSPKTVICCKSRDFMIPPQQKSAVFNIRPISQYAWQPAHGAQSSVAKVRRHGIRPLRIIPQNVGDATTGTFRAIAK